MMLTPRTYRNFTIPLAKSIMETRVVSCHLQIFSDMPKRTEKRGEELISPSKKWLENRATWQDEGEELAGPSSAEDTVSNIV